MPRAKPAGRGIVWTGGRDPRWAGAAIDRLPPTVEVMCVSEEAMPIRVGGINGEVHDYSISQVGPGNLAKELWQRARNRGLKTIAKVQLNNSWECSAVPYIPAVDLVEKHLDNLSGAGVQGLMVSWTLGGYPGGNLELLVKRAEDLARDKFGPRAVPAIRRAWELFSRAFPEFPFDHNTVYHGPHNPGPMNLLSLQPTGYAATMVGFPYDDLKKWRAVYPQEVFENQFKKLSETWKQGLDQLDSARPMVGSEYRGAYEDLLRVARAVYCHFRSAYLQTAFIRCRDSGHGNKKSEMIAIVEEEIELAKTLYSLARQDARIGFESSNHYAYTLNDLREKVIACEFIRTLLRS